jgi:hypothetical protein
VIDFALARVPGARVSIQAGGPSTVTDADGAFELPAASGTGLVVVAARKEYFKASTIVTTPTTHVVIALEPVPQDDDPSYTLAAPETCGAATPISTQAMARRADVSGRCQ